MKRSYGLRHERDHWTSAAQPGTASNRRIAACCRHEDDGPGADARLSQVREDRRRGDGQLPSHGDASIDALVRLAQDFNMRYPLVTGRATWVDRRRPARVCATEARLEAAGDDMMTDLDETIVSRRLRRNQKAILRRRSRTCSSTDRRALPSAWPQRAPHNLREVVDGCIWLIENVSANRRARRVRRERGIR
jgi:hypothetical protein